MKKLIFVLALFLSSTIIAQELPKDLCGCIEVSIKAMGELDNLSDMEMNEVLSPEVQKHCEELADKLEKEYEENGQSYEDWEAEMMNNCPAMQELVLKMNAMMESLTDSAMMQMDTSALKEAFEEAMEELEEVKEIEEEPETEKKGGLHLKNNIRKEEE